MQASVMWDRSRVVVVVPAFDEAPRIARVVRGVPAWVDQLVVVDDGSRDGTSDVVRGLGDPRVVLIEHPVNRGVGAALSSGYRRALSLTVADRDVFAVMAGDGQMDPADLERLVAPVAAGAADYVKGDRFRSLGALRTIPLSRLLAGRALSWGTARAIGVPISDSQCGYTAISRRACAEVDLDGLWPGYGYPNDLLSQIALRGLRIGQVGVRPIYADEVSRLKARHVPVVVALVARAWLRRRALGPAESAHA